MHAQAPPELQRLAQALARSADDLGAALGDESLERFELLMRARSALLAELAAALRNARGLPSGLVEETFALAWQAEARLRTRLLQERNRIGVEMERLSELRGIGGRLADGYAPSAKGAEINLTA
jgi:hypothetical protein